MSLMTNFKNKAQALLLAGSTLSATTMPFQQAAADGLATEPTTQNTTYQRTALSLAAEYSMNDENPRIGVAVSRSPDTNVSVEELKHFFESNFKKYGIPAQAFVEEEPSYKNTTISFYLDGISSDTYLLKDIKGGFKEAVQLYRAVLSKRTGTPELANN